MLPVHKKIQPLIEKSFSRGNFGLWFYKFVELKELDGKFKPDNNAVFSYLKKYNQIRNNISNLLFKKHFNQLIFCDSYKTNYIKLTATSKLISPMIVGIGQTHPNEVGMTFDYTLGIPYIPASSIKGVVRFTHTTSIIDEAIKSGKVVNDEFGDNLFGKGGNEGNRGKAIFLDAYPEKIPELKVDVMNPHYDKYYLDEKGKTAPTDYLQPKPIFFLTVDKNTKFIFRILIDKRCEKLLDTAKNALKEALTIYGIGAKTSVGYGIFEIEKWEESDFLNEEYKKYISL